jgi:ABC-2 type transport system ATP-binding protein
MSHLELARGEDLLVQLCSDHMADNKNTQPAIRVERLTRKFGKVLAVDNLSLDVPAGILFGFLGPNGAGKSTTIGCLTGLIDPTSGEIALLGQPFRGNSASLKRRIGVMPEGLALFDQLYPQEFLAFNGRMLGLDQETTNARVDELLQTLDLTGARNRRLADFSTGMRKKVAFAAAIIHRPDILFLDEPFESIDPATVSMLKGWLRHYVAQGGTVFLTSHVLDTVERFCSEVAIIKEGRLAWRGLMPSEGGTIVVDGKGFGSLEELFLHIVGEQTGELDWL